jgi:hypothetical protein
MSRQKRSGSGKRSGRRASARSLIPTATSAGTGSLSPRPSWPMRRLAARARGARQSAPRRTRPQPASPSRSSCCPSGSTWSASCSSSRGSAALSRWSAPFCSARTTPSTPSTARPWACTGGYFCYERESDDVALHCWLRNLLLLTRSGHRLPPYRVNRHLPGGPIGAAEGVERSVREEVVVVPLGARLGVEGVADDRLRLASVC